MNNIYSGLFKLNARDLTNGLIIVFLAAVIKAVLSTATNGVASLTTWPFWDSTLNIGWQAAALYLGKNFLSDSNGNVLGFGRKAN